jgi:hypothetical protein
MQTRTSDTLSGRGSGKPPVANYSSLQRQPTKSSQIFKGGASQKSASVFSETASDMIFVEDYFAEMDDQFISNEFKPYLQGVFADFAMRSTPSSQQSSQGKSIDKVTFTEYINLPGMLSDRFFAIAKKERADNRVYEEDFLNVMLSVFTASLEQKINFVFQV